MEREVRELNFNRSLHAGVLTHDSKMKPAVRKISVIAPARLHFGFLDPDGTGARRYGSVGLALNAPVASISVERASALQVVGPQAQRVRAFVERLRARCNFPAQARVEIHEAIDEHAGLGSGTQLGLAAGLALSRLYERDIPAREVAAIVGRGNRSGIGVGAFEAGGFLVDGGRSAEEEVPSIVARIAFPEEWRIVLVFDNASRGLHGVDEVAAFASLPRFSEVASGGLCRLVLLQALPALAGRDFDLFSNAIGELQRITGDHFSSAQGGRFASPRVARVLQWFEDRGVHGIGQSSWGPTGFAIVSSQAEAERLVGELRAENLVDPAISVKVCAGRNEGGVIEDAGSQRRSALAS